MAVVKKEAIRVEPSVAAMCKELGIDAEFVQKTLNDAKRRDRAFEQTKEPKGTPGHVLAKYIGAWDMSDEEWEAIYRDLKAMSVMSD